jgi:serine/threonine protein kinase
VIPSPEMAEATSGRARRPGDEHTAGDVLDRRYRLLSRLGRGGFGDVWRAEELLPDGAPFREVALKLLHGGGGDATDWAEEAKLLASFRHPSLVTIYAAGILAMDPPQRYVAMELLEGQNLADLIRGRGRIPWRRVLRWACNTAAALDVIHALGVVHLDLKPANLFLATDGALKVLDFGIARRAGPRQARGARDAASVDAPRASAPAREADGDIGTAVFLAEQGAFAATQAMVGEAAPPAGPATAQVVIGTPGFIAPELLELADPTAAADAYALAVCIVQLTSGRFPHAAEDEPASWDDSIAVSTWLDGIRQATLRGALREFDADPRLFPLGLAALVRKLLSLDPVHRGVVPGQLGQMLEEVWQRPHGVPDPPYPGLAPYTAQGEGVLFGRDDDIARLGRELEIEPAVVLQGVRGVGKTSLAVAGLAPYLALRGVDGKDDWVAVRIVPGAAPDRALADALAAISPELVDADAAALAAYCDASPVGLALLVDPLGDVLDAPAADRVRIEALIVAIAEATPSVDRDREREPRPGQLAAIRGASPGLRLLVTLSDEHAAALLAAEPLGGSLRAALRFVGAPAPAAVRDIVGGPAHFAGVPLQGIDDIAADVQRELRAGGARLPYVALALRSLWDAGPSRGKRGDSARSSARPASLGADLWKKIGGVRGAVARHADGVFARLTSSDRLIAEEILLRLSTAEGGTSIPWDEDELARTFEDRTDEARRVLATLAREHLVRRQGSTVELGHEAIATAWPHLASARLQSLSRLLFLERVREARVAWERGDRSPDLLLQGALFDELRAHPDRAARGLTAADRDLVRESRRRARLRTGAKVFAVLAGVGGLALGLVAKEMVDAARESEKTARSAAIELERTAELAAKSRRTEDPFRKAAFATAAMERGSPDGMLPIDLASSVANVARADFLTLEHVSGPEFPWEDRYLLGQTSSGTLTLVDFHPPESEVIEDLDIDADLEPAAAKRFKRPRVLEVRPHADPLAERAAFAFDTSFATRSVTGEVKVFRLRDDGEPALAAIAPIRCSGTMRLAAAAPVLACATDQGIARWDLRLALSNPGGAVTSHAFQGNVAGISADGARVAATEGSRVLLWAPDEHREATYVAEAPVLLAEWSPRDPLLAVVESAGFEIVDFTAPPAGTSAPAGTPPPALFRDRLSVVNPDSARWDAGGLDLAFCDASRHGRWAYLKRGGRAKDDAPPTGSPCARPAPPSRPRELALPSDFDELAAHDLGPHSPLGGWRLGSHRFLTRDLVVFNAAEPAAGHLLRFEGHDEIGGDEELSPLDSAVAVERAEKTVAWQIAEEVRVYSLPEGNRLFSRRGHLLRRCEDGSIRAWQSTGKTFQIFDVWTGGAVAEIPREPALVIGADSACKVLYTQRLDGAIVETQLASGAARVLARTDGYVYDARPSLGAPGALASSSSFGPGLWLAVSSGAIARIEELTGEVRVAGYATPRAAALTDGAHPGDVAYADAGGIVLLRAQAPEAQTGRLSWRSERMLEATGESPWEDLSMAPDGASMLLASADRLASLDLARHEIVGWMNVEGKTRLSRWDDEGSVLAWSFDRVGGAEGQVIPRGIGLAKLVAASISNLGAEKGKLVIHR